MDKMYHEKINNKWIITNKIGRGSYGTIYNCIKTKKYPSEFAIKILRENHESKNEIFVYKYLKKLQGNIIPKIYDYGGPFKDGLVYIVMEKLYQPGEKLYKIRSIIEYLDIFAKNNIIHGDIKPENIMLRKETDDLVIIDWGLSCILSDKNATPSGTLIYMSTFAHQGKISFRNDLESLFYCILSEISELPWRKTIRENLNNSENGGEILSEGIFYEKINFMKKIICKCPKIMKKFKLYELKSLYKFGIYIFSLERTDIPDYNYLKSLFPTL